MSDQIRFVFPLATKVAEPVTRCLLKLFMTFKVSYFLRNDAGGKFTAEVVQPVSRWLNVKLDYESANHPREQGAVESRVSGASPAHTSREKSRRGNHDAELEAREAEQPSRPTATRMDYAIPVWRGPFCTVFKFLSRIPYVV